MSKKHDRAGDPGAARPATGAVGPAALPAPAGIDEGEIDLRVGHGCGRGVQAGGKLRDAPEGFAEDGVRPDLSDLAPGHRFPDALQGRVKRAGSCRAATA